MKEPICPMCSAKNFLPKMKAWEFNNDMFLTRYDCPVCGFVAMFNDNRKLSEK